MNQKVVLLDGDQRFLQQLIEAFTKGGWHVAATTDGVQALRECRDADLLVTELVLPGMDGIEVIEEMKKSCPAKALVISGIRSQEMMAKVLAKGGDYFLSKPVRAELVCERARMLVEPRKEEPKREEKNVGHFLDERLTNVFLTVGIPANIKGYAYLKEGIKLAVQKPSIISQITKGLYPEIAARCGTSASRVERAIRHAIDVAWCRGKIQNINAVFGLKIYGPHEKPTNSEFIALLADKMLLEIYSKN